MINITQEEIMKNWQGDIQHPLLSVRCITYNHENYIEQALDGFLMQKTNFPFEVIVHDDASTDKTADIIREYEKKYPNIIKPIYQTENQYSKRDGSIGRIMNDACKGKYIAFCEGDDYWIDENKLQMQVDVLEKNRDVTICYCRVQVFENDKNIFTIPFDNNIKGGGIELKDFTFEEYNRGAWCFHTSSFFVTAEVLKDYTNTSEDVFKGFPYGDMPLQLYALCNGKGYFIDKVMSKYRWLSGGYNSYILAHPEKAIADEAKLIKALEKFDEYTEFKYHEDILHRINRAHIKIATLSHDRGYALKYIKIKDFIQIFYPRISLSLHDKRQALVGFLKKNLPGVFKFLRKIYRFLKKITIRHKE